jgi:outer membrane protein assembly factor BamB
VIRVGAGGAGPGDPAGRRSRRLLGLGLLIGIGLPFLIVAGVGVGLYQTLFKVPELRALLFEGGRVARGAVLPLADGAVVLSQENAQPVAEVIRSGARQAGQARVYLTRIAVAPGEKPRWDVALDGITGPDAGQVRVWLDGDRVLVASGERLQARALATGTTLWTATLSDAIHGPCRQCLALGGGRVVALTADGVVQAVDAASGRALWRTETRLNRPIAPDLEVVGDLVGLVDRGADGRQAELLLVRADTGQPVRRIRPACAMRDPGPDTTQAEYAGDRVVLALGRAGVAAGGEGAVWSLAVDTGRLRAFPVPEGYETRALDARDGVVVLRATRQRGTIRDELWAMDLETGTVLWQKPLATSGGAPPRWTARAGPAGVGLLQALDRPNRLAYEALELRTGRSLLSATLEVEAASWEGVAWTDDAAWLTIASPYRVDLRAGVVARAWPWQSLANCQNIGGKIVCTR